MALFPADAFKERVRKFKQYLLARPEACVAVVAHWGLIAELTGHDFDNCEVQSFRLHENGTITPDW
jgi:broad specificity phosphatase PhoE